VNLSSLLGLYSVIWLKFFFARICVSKHASQGEVPEHDFVGCFGEYSFEIGMVIFHLFDRTQDIEFEFEASKTLLCFAIKLLNKS